MSKNNSKRWIMIVSIIRHKEKCRKKGRSGYIKHQQYEKVAALDLSSLGPRAKGNLAPSSNSPNNDTQTKSTTVCHKKGISTTKMN
jgi:hypothetical protein